MAGLRGRMKVYQATALFSVLFALVGFTYNVWRMEVSEHNDTVRNASFEMLLQLAELEQLIYAAHYDRDSQAGNPRVGWVKVGLIVDLSFNCSEPVQAAAAALKDSWAANWDELVEDRAATDSTVAAIDAARGAVQAGLRSLD